MSKWKIQKSNAAKKGSPQQGRIAIDSLSGFHQRTNGYVRYAIAIPYSIAMLGSCDK